MTIERNEMLNAVKQILFYIGEDMYREGLAETPDRVLRSWNELYKGYNMEVGSVIKTFEAPSSKEMILIKDIDFFSMCEHHMLPFFGLVHVAYIPNSRIIGASKVPRIVEIFSRRLQIQERLGDQITEAIMDSINPLGCACLIDAEHMCMKMRGVEKQRSRMVTSSLRGLFLESREVRTEFFGMLR